MNEMNTVTRHCINPKIKLYFQYDLARYTDYTELCLSIDFWKTLLVEKYNVQPGQTIFIRCDLNLYYHAVLFAAVELGLVLIIDWPHCYTEQDVDDYKVTVFGKIDYIVTSQSYYDPKYPGYQKWEHQRDLKHGRNIIFQEDFDNYIIQDPAIFEKMKTEFRCSPDSPFLYSVSSGTTGLPKLLTDHHAKIYQMANRFADLLFDVNDTVLHTTNLHHGASLCYYFLPAFMKGQAQYMRHEQNFSTENIRSIVKLVEEYKINQIFCFLTAVLVSFLKETSILTHKLKITTLFQIPTDAVRLLKEKNITQIGSVFGDTTIGVGFFMKTVDQTTNLDTYDVTNMGAPLDDFYKFKLEDNQLWISIPKLGQDWRTSNDIFEIIDNNYHFRGRSNQYRINGEWVRLRDIESIVDKLFGLNGANIIIDNDMQRIYLAIWKPNPDAEIALSKFFDETYTIVKIDYVLRDLNYENFLGARKIDNNKLRQYFRETFILRK
jgi:hypothetical protein